MQIKRCLGVIAKEGRGGFWEDQAVGGGCGVAFPTQLHAVALASPGKAYCPWL